MESQIKAAIFDLGKVVVNFDHMTFCKRLSLYSSFNEQEIYCKIFESGLEVDFDTGKIDAKQFCNRIRSELRLELSDKRISRLWVSIFSLNTGIDKIILKLKNKYRLLCLSNTNSLHFNYCLANFDILNEFEFFMLSYKLGYKKPEPQIYIKALEMAELRADECLYIDDVEEYAQASQKIGMKSIRFISVNQLEADLLLIGLL